MAKKHTVKRKLNIPMDLLVTCLEESRRKEGKGAGSRTKEMKRRGKWLKVAA